MAKPFPVSPSHPERICWGCDRYCAASALACGNGADRTMHPVEVFGEDWNEPTDYGLDRGASPLPQQSAGTGVPRD